MATVLERLRAALASRYAVEREIGRGGMATVFLAQDLKHGRPVALKMLRPDIAAAVGAERFLQEIEIAARLNHPHILPLHDSGDAEGFLYYVMPYVAGESLRDRLNEQGQLALEEALHIAREVADALDYAHRHNVVHRDIKPENILLVEGHALVADFGIARAIRAAGKARATETGVAVGTPEYMSPEQSGGRMEPDGRSDIYALGCVLYEMLAGEPPFTASSVQGLVARHLSDPPPRLRTIRSTVPIEVEQVIETALAKAPADRFASAQQFAAALPIISGPRPLRAPALSPRAQRWSVLGSAGALVIAALIVVPLLFGGSLDRSLFVVVPFGHRGMAAPRLLDGDRCEGLLNDAFTRWTDIRLKDRMAVRDHRQRQGNAPMTYDLAVETARDLGAGHLVWGEVWESEDSVFIYAALYNLVGGVRVQREWTVGFGERENPGERFNQLADSLLLGVAASKTSADGAAGTHVYAAWQAYDSGHAAVGRWDLDGAARAFDSALQRDPGYPHAHLWRALVGTWVGDSVHRWQRSAVAAFAARHRLGAREASLAAALVDMAGGRYPQACARYEELLARSPDEFAALFGLAECHKRDRVVIPDARSRSGYSFRGSYHTAAEAYRRALETIPSMHFAFRGAAFARLTDLISVESDFLRFGYALTPDTVRFAAYASFEGDTVAFVPYPRDSVLSAAREAVPTTTPAAMRRNRAVARDITTTWVRTFPFSGDAREALALVLETLGEIGLGDDSLRSALAQIGRARQLAVEPDQRLRLALSQARLLVKQQEFEAARTLADSALEATTNPTAQQARLLAGLAALTGRAHHTVELLRRSAPADSLRGEHAEVVLPPPRVMEAALALRGYAAFGAPVDSIRELGRAVDRLLRLWVAPDQREAVRRAALDVPAELAFPTVGLSAVHRPRAPGKGLLEMQWLLSHGDTAGVRRRFGRLSEIRYDVLPGEVAIERTFLEAQLLLALRDTAAALQRLNAPLDALQTLGSDLLAEVPQAAGLVRALALRAELAARAGDRGAAQQSARAVVTLWSGADPELQPVVQRMRELAEE